LPLEAAREFITLLSGAAAWPLACAGAEVGDSALITSEGARHKPPIPRPMMIT
jgi:hypothetical protein